MRQWLLRKQDWDTWSSNYFAFCRHFPDHSEEKGSKASQLRSCWIKKRLESSGTLSCLKPKGWISRIKLQRKRATQRCLEACPWVSDWALLYPWMSLVSSSWTVPEFLHGWELCVCISQKASWHMELRSRGQKSSICQPKRERNYKIGQNQSIISERANITWGWYRIGLTAVEEREIFSRR